MTEKKDGRTPTIHEKEMVLNENALKELLNIRGMAYNELWDKCINKYGLDITYKGFMSLLKNRSTWKLLYAHAIADILLVQYTDIFEVVDIDVNKEKIKRKKWKERYGKKDQ